MSGGAESETEGSICDSKEKQDRMTTMKGEAMSATLAMTPPYAVDSRHSEFAECYEILDGVRVEIPPMSAEATVIAFELARHMANFGIAGNFGRAITEGLFHLPLPMDRNRRPDVAFVSFSRWPQTKRIPSSNAWDVLPDIVAEVISPNDLAEEVLDKLLEYFRSGIRLAWVIYPKQQLVYVYESPTKPHVLTRDESLDGGVVLPGFQLPLAKLFPAEASA